MTSNGGGMLVPEEISMLITSDPTQGASNISADGSSFSVSLDSGIAIPSDALNVNLRVESATVWWVVPNISAEIGNNKMYFDEGGVPYVVTIPDGLYDLTEFNQMVARELEGLGATSIPDPLATFSPDDATQRVVMRLNYVNVSVDFTQVDTPRLILGFNAAVIGPLAGAPEDVLADNTANFNAIDYFLLHTDLIHQGIRFNNTYNQTIAQVLIDVPPGSQIISEPRHPARVGAQELAATNKTSMRWWITDQSNQPIDTLGEYWTARFVITYLKPFVIASNKRRI